MWSAASRAFWLSKPPRAQVRAARDAESELLTNPRRWSMSSLHVDREVTAATKTKDDGHDTGRPRQDGASDLAPEITSSDDSGGWRGRGSILEPPTGRWLEGEGVADVQVQTGRVPVLGWTSTLQRKDGTQRGNLGVVKRTLRPRPQVGAAAPSRRAPRGLYLHEREPEADDAEDEEDQDRHDQCELDRRCPSRRGGLAVGSWRASVPRSRSCAVLGQWCRAGTRRCTVSASRLFSLSSMKMPRACRTTLIA